MWSPGGSCPAGSRHSGQHIASPMANPAASKGASAGPQPAVAAASAELGSTRNPSTAVGGQLTASQQQQQVITMQHGVDLQPSDMERARQLAIQAFEKSRANSSLGGEETAAPTAPTGITPSSGLQQPSKSGRRMPASLLSASGHNAAGLSAGRQHAAWQQGTGLPMAQHAQQQAQLAVEGDDLEASATLEQHGAAAWPRAVPTSPHSNIRNATHSSRPGVTGGSMLVGYAAAAEGWLQAGVSQKQPHELLDSGPEVDSTPMLGALHPSPPSPAAGGPPGGVLQEGQGRAAPSQHQEQPLLHPTKQERLKAEFWEAVHKRAALILAGAPDEEIGKVVHKSDFPGLRLTQTEELDAALQQVNAMLHAHTARKAAAALHPGSVVGADAAAAAAAPIHGAGPHPTQLILPQAPGGAGSMHRGSAGPTNGGGPAGIASNSTSFNPAYISQVLYNLDRPPGAPLDLETVSTHAAGAVAAVTAATEAYSSGRGAGGSDRFLARLPNLGPVPTSSRGRRGRPKGSRNKPRGAAAASSRAQDDGDWSAAAADGGAAARSAAGNSGRGPHPWADLFVDTSPVTPGEASGVPSRGTGRGCPRGAGGRQGAAGRGGGRAGGRGLQGGTRRVTPGDTSHQGAGDGAGGTGDGASNISSFLDMELAAVVPPTGPNPQLGDQRVAAGAVDISAASASAGAAAASQEALGERDNGDSSGAGLGGTQGGVGRPPMSAAASGGGSGGHGVVAASGVGVGAVHGAAQQQEQSYDHQLLSELAPGGALAPPLLPASASADAITTGGDAAAPMEVDGDGQMLQQQPQQQQDQQQQQQQQAAPEERRPHRSDQAGFNLLVKKLSGKDPSELSPADLVKFRAAAYAIFDHAAASEDGIATVGKWGACTWVSGSLVEILLQLVKDAVDWKMAKGWTAGQRAELVQLLLGWVDWAARESGRATSRLTVVLDAAGKGMMVRGWTGCFFPASDLLPGGQLTAAETAVSAAASKAGKRAISRWRDELKKEVELAQQQQQLGPDASTLRVGAGPLFPTKYGVLFRTHLQHLLDPSTAEPALRSAMCGDAASNKQVKNMLAAMLAQHGVTCWPGGMPRAVGAAGGGTGPAAAAAGMDAGGQGGAAAGVAAALRMTRDAFLQRYATALHDRPAAILNNDKVTAVNEVLKAAADAASMGESSMGPAALMARLAARDPPAAGAPNNKKQKKEVVG